MAGETGLDFTSAVTFAAFREATAIEATAGGYSEVLKARQVKINDLAEVLSLFSKAVANLKVKGGKSTDKVTVDNADWVKRTCAKYDISFVWSGNQMERGNLQKAQTEVQYQMDKEDNFLQQDMVSLQSYITKRDNAYSTAAKVVKKTLNAGAADTRRGVEYGKGTSKKENLGDAPVDVLTTLNDEAKKSAEDFYDDIKSGKGSGRYCSNACCQNAIKKK